MEKLFKIPFAFFLIAAWMGFFLRLYPLVPFDWMNYPNWLHGHSHTMFLGWIFNFILLAFLSRNGFFGKRRYRVLFGWIQFTLVGIMVSFPIQGYKPISIGFSAAHTFSVWLLIFWLLSDLRRKRSSVSFWFLKVTLWLFVLSSLGPFMLAYLKGIGLGNSVWYYDALYFYLHFQYNGVFIFAMLSLWFQILEEREISFNTKRATRNGILLLVSLGPTFALSTLWSNPHAALYWIGLAGAIMQAVSFCYLVPSIYRFLCSTKQLAGLFIRLSLFAIIIKTALQIISAMPVVADLAYRNRPYVIAYVHLSVIGITTFFLFGWSIERGIVRLSPLAMTLMVAGFIGTELTMILGNLIFSPASGSYLLLITSAFLVIGITISLVPLFARLNSIDKSI